MEKARAQADLSVFHFTVPVAAGRELADLLSRANSGLRVISMPGYPAAEVATDGQPFVQKPFTIEPAATTLQRTLAEAEKP